MTSHIYDLIIIGSGPAGLAAAVYAQRACLDTLIIERSTVSGGQILNTRISWDQRLRTGNEAAGTCRPSGCAI